MIPTNPRGTSPRPGGRTPVKTVYVVLAFHAHTPFPGLAARLRVLSGDGGLAAVPAGGEDGLAAAVAAVGRLLALGEALSAPVTLQASNEWLASLRRSAGRRRWRGCGPAPPTSARRGPTWTGASPSCSRTTPSG